MSCSQHQGGVHLSHDVHPLWFECRHILLRFLRGVAGGCFLRGEWRAPRKKNAFSFDCRKREYTQISLLLPLSLYIDISPKTFFLQGSPEAFDHCVVVTVALSAHTHLNVVLSQQVLIGFACVFAPSIRVMHEASSWLSLHECYVQCFFDELGVMIAPYGPTNDFLRIRIDHSSKVEPSLLCLNERHIGHPLCIWCVRCKVSLQQVWHEWIVLITCGFVHIPPLSQSVYL